MFTSMSERQLFTKPLAKFFLPVLRVLTLPPWHTKIDAVSTATEPACATMANVNVCQAIPARRVRPSVVQTTALVWEIAAMVLVSAHSTEVETTALKMLVRRTALIMVLAITEHAPASLAGRDLFATSLYASSTALGVVSVLPLVHVIAQMDSEVTSAPSICAIVLPTEHVMYLVDASVSKDGLVKTALLLSATAATTTELVLDLPSASVTRAGLGSSVLNPFVNAPSMENVFHQVNANVLLGGRVKLAV